MTFDAITLHAVRDTLEAELAGGFVEKVALVGSLDILLQVYARHQKRYLLISAEPERARVCLVASPPASATGEVTPLLLLLRKYARDGRIEGFDQPPLERLLKVRLTRRDAEGVLRAVWLIIEPMGRRSNVILVGEDGTILDALKRAGPSVSPTRPVLPHRRYEPPPAQARLDPRLPGTWAALRDEVAERAGPVSVGRRGRSAALLAGTPPTLADFLAARLMGFSPLAAREAAFRATGSVEAPLSPGLDWPKVRQAALALLGPLAGGVWSPSIARRDGRVVAFAPYRLTHLPGATVDPVPDICAAVSAYFAQAPVERPTGPVLAQPLIRAIDDRRRTVERRLSALERALSEVGDPEELRAAGEAVLACASAIAPGQERLSFAGRTIDLDPRLGPIENAQRYFREYRKAREAARRVPELAEQARIELAYLAELRALAELADDPARVRALRAELDLAGARPGAPTGAGDGPAPGAAGARGRRKGDRKRVGREPAASRPLRVSSPEGFEILVGTSARGNDEVTFRLAGPEDLWLHARGAPGAHVVVRSGGQPVPEPTLVAAARLAARHSAVRAQGKVQVDCVPRRQVKKVPGGPPGLVRYSGERTLLVAPAD